MATPSLPPSTSLPTPVYDGYPHPSRLPTCGPPYISQDYLHWSSACFIHSRGPHPPIQGHQICHHSCPFPPIQTFHILSLFHRCNPLRVCPSLRATVLKLSPPRPICPQPKGKTVEEELFAFSGSEASMQNLKQIESECLNLNITCPGSLTRGSRLPVMVWIHGCVHPHAHLLRSGSLTTCLSS